MRGVLWAVIGSLTILPGCQKESSDAKSKTKSAPRANKVVDAVDAIHTLKQAGARLRRDKTGCTGEVNLREQTVEASTLKALHGLPRLRSVLLTDSSVDDAGLAELANLKTVTNLDIRGCPITNAGLGHLKSLKQLRALRLSGENNKTSVNDEGLATLAGLVNLKVLMLDFLWVGETGLSALSKANGLEELTLKKSLVGDDAMSVIVKQFPRLRTLRIAQTQVSDAGLKTLTGLTRLTELDLSENTRLTDAGVEHIGAMLELQKLNLWRCPFTDDGIAHLSGLVKMKWLNLDNTSLADPGLDSLRSMKQIEFLHLGSTAVTDQGTSVLANLTSLRELKLTRTAVTESAVAELQKKLPRTAIQLKYTE